MTFENYQYTRPDTNQIKKQLETLIEKLNSVNTVEETLEIFNEYNKLRNSIETLAQLVEIRVTIDTTDKFYEAEQEFWDEFGPELDSLYSKFDKAMFDSKFKEELKKEIGEHYFNLIEASLKVFSDKIIEDLKEENKLTSEYTKLTSSAKIPFDGGVHNLSGMAKYTQDANRETRLSASQAVAKFFKENLEQYDSIYDRMIKVRTRLGLEKLSFHDEGVTFKSGNPTPKGDRPTLVDYAKTMYKELSPETDEFFTFMTENNLLDLDTKPGKAGGGYCTFIPDYKAPFIFANFNQTPHDVTVLTHEAGHAFQVFQSRNHMPDYVWPTFEACEIHSMSMEFLTWPWMNLFFKEDTDKFKYYHMTTAIKFLPYGVTVDEFQHEVYENPELTPQERRMKWLEVERKYLPSRYYEEIPELDEGLFFYRQGHLFSVPFYYIDYTLAQVCAFQFWKKANENREKAWAEYLHLCKQGGTKPFLELVKEANLENPFKDGTISNIVPELKKYIDSVDTTKF